MKSLKYIFSLALFLFTINLSAQTTSDSLIFRALSDEMSRNITGLKLENQKTPFFINTYLLDGQYFAAKATLGSLIRSIKIPFRNPATRLMVGDYAINDENFVSGSQSYNSGGAYLALPLEDSYLAIRRVFWSLLDRSYKTAIDNYTQKLTVLKQQNKDENEIIDDYSRTQPVSFFTPYKVQDFDKALWENNIKKISLIFKDYPLIQNSSVDVLFLNSNIYSVNSEGSKTRNNVSVACLLVNATTQAVDGEVLNDQVLCYAPIGEDLPAIDKISAKVTQMAKSLNNRRSAMVIEEAYQGPVIFEGDALAELFNNKLFSYNGLLTSREPIYAVVTSKGTNNKLENKIGKRLCVENLSVISKPMMKMFENTPLIGSFEIDAEGVIPEKELTLIDKGILKTLLSDRVPTPKVKQSNGYCRYSPFGARQKCPGVIDISYSNGQTYNNLIKSVTKETAKNGLEYFYIVRKFETTNIGQYVQINTMGFSKPVAIYKVSVKTGAETLVRCASISDFPMFSLKYALGGTNEKVVYNMVNNQLFPVSYIVPKAMAFNDVSIEKENSPKGKLPIVESPLVVKSE